MRVPWKIRPLPGGATEYVFVGNVHCEASQQNFHRYALTTYQPVGMHVKIKFAFAGDFGSCPGLSPDYPEAPLSES